MIRTACLVAASLSGVALLIAGAAPVQAGTSARATAYLLSAQNADGGFGTGRGEKSDPMLTGWAALGLAAAGHSPRQESAKRRSTIAYLRSRTRSRDAGALARTLLVLHAAGLTPRFAGRDIRAELLRHRRSDGSFDGLVNLTAFGILAARASGDPADLPSIQRSASWLTRQQNPDGGFSYLPGATSGVDDTAAVLQALVAAGMRESLPARNAADYLLAAQQASGGFGSTHSPSPYAANSMSTAWAVQALSAAGHDPAQVAQGGRTPLHYLRSLQNPDGSIRYSRQRNHNPVWATAQALLALTGRPFPIDPVPVKARPTPADHSPAPVQRTRQPSATDGRARSQQATALKHPSDGAHVTDSDGVTSTATPTERERATASSAPKIRRRSALPERTPSRSRPGLRPVPGHRNAASPGGRHVDGVLLAVALVALTAFGYWRWRAHRKADSPPLSRGPGNATVTGAEAQPGHPDHLERELAILLADQSLQEPSDAAQTDAESQRTLEPR
jgi:prenyltransferase beta subunit